MCLVYKPILSKPSKCQRLCNTPATLATDSPSADVPTTVAAPDADSEGRNEGVANLDDVEPDETPAATIRQDICHTCDQDEPPARKGRPHRGPVHWVRCDLCPR